MSVSYNKLSDATPSIRDINDTPNKFLSTFISYDKFSVSTDSRWSRVALVQNQFRFQRHTCARDISRKVYLMSNWSSLPKLFLRCVLFALLSHLPSYTRCGLSWCDVSRYTYIAQSSERAVEKKKHTFTFSYCCFRGL